MGDRVEIVPRLRRLVRRGAQLGREGRDARQRGLEIVGDAAQEVGLHAREAVQLIGLLSDLGVEERVLEGGPGVLADEGQEGDLRRRRVQPSLPGGIEDRSQSIAT